MTLRGGNHDGNQVFIILQIIVSSHISFVKHPKMALNAPEACLLSQNLVSYPLKFFAAFWSYTFAFVISLNKKANEKFTLPS